MPRFFADMRGLRGAAFAATLVAAPASSIASPDTLDLPSTATRGTHVPAPAEGAHRLEGEALRRFATLEDALASLPGFRVRRAGGLGGYSELSFRGARATAVEVYVDGVRLNQDGDGAPDFSKWPSLWFTSLTARTGFDAEGASAGALARIDLSTRPVRAVGAARTFELHARAGSFAAYEGAAQVAAPLSAGSPWELAVSAQLQSARNDYPVNSDNGTLYNTADDAIWNMGNNAYASRGMRAAARRGDANGSQELSLLWLDSRKEYPGLFPSTAHAYTERTDWLGAWRLTRGTRGPRGIALEAGAQVRRLEDSYKDPNQSLGAFSLEQARVSTAAELDGAVTVPFAGGRGARQRDGKQAEREGLQADARVDVRLRGENIEPTATPHTQQMASPAATRREAGAGARIAARGLPLLPGALTLTAEARPAWIRFEADGVRSFPSGPLSAPVSETFAPLALRAAAEWPTRAGTWGLVARREPRAPSSGEFLGDNNGVQHNPTLRAEEARAVSLLHALRFGSAVDGESTGDAPRTPHASSMPWSVRFETSLFLNTYHDPIRLAQRGASSFLRYENGAAYRARGAEVSAYGSLPLAEASASLTLQSAEITEGFDKGNTPAHFNGTQAHAESFLKPVSGARAGVLVDYRGPYYPGDANIPVSHRDAEWELGAHAGYARGPARLALDARNLLDTRTRDFAYSPRSGRAFALTLSLSF